MAINRANLQLFYTGGGATAVPNLSIGGAISSTRLLSQAATAIPLLSGVTIDEVLGATPGLGTLVFTASTKMLTFQPFGGSVGTAVDISADGVYFVQGANNGGGLCITVVAASLPTSNTTVTTTISNNTQKFFLDQTKSESNAGVTKYHCFAIKNTHATDPIIDIKLWIAANTPGADTCTLFLDALAASNGATGPTAVANENTAPAASTFVAPDSATHADVLAVGTLAASEVRFFWIKQATPAGVTVATPVNTFSIGTSARM
jgi:hypothetical protein